MFYEDPDRVLTRAEWAAIDVDLAKKASDARELLWLKKKQENELRSNAKPLTFQRRRTHYTPRP